MFTYLRLGQISNLNLNKHLWNLQNGPFLKKREKRVTGPENGVVWKSRIHDPLDGTSEGRREGGRRRMSRGRTSHACHFLHLSYLGLGQIGRLRRPIRDRSRRDRKVYYKTTTNRGKR